MITQTCCFTGHRHIPTQDLPDLYPALSHAIQTLIQQGYRYFGSGGALGFDTLAAVEVLRLKKQFPHIRLILVLPYPRHWQRWKKADADQFQRILASADKTVWTSRRYERGCMAKRNRHLVDCSSACVCYLRRHPSGTAYTVEYAKKKGLSIVAL